MATPTIKYREEKLTRLATLLADYGNDCNDLKLDLFLKLAVQEVINIDIGEDAETTTAFRETKGQSVQPISPAVIVHLQSGEKLRMK
jgi:hypothetical protein